MSDNVVLIHGLFVRAMAMTSLAKRFRAAGFESHLFNYETRSAPLPELADQLYEFITSRSVETMHLLAHSMGGLVTLQMLAQYDSLPLGRIVLIGSPVQGNKLAQHIVKKSAGRRLFGQAGAGLTDGLQQPEHDREIGVIAGTRPYGLGRLIRVFHEPNDGTVAVAETRLEGATASIELPVTHTGMLFSNTVAQQSICFFKSGAFQQNSDQN
jgi:pimeloyl-ACP methyl ester carboxylesterase